MKRFRKILFGERTPEISDPGYAEKGRRAQEAGANITKFLRLDKAAAATQRFAGKRPVLFLVIVFGIATFFFSLNAVRIVQYSRYRRTQQSAVAVQRDSIINKLLIEE